MYILKLKSFFRWAMVEGLSDAQLKMATTEMVKGLMDADLGSGLYKKRIARKGAGKRGGYRTLLAFKDRERAIFLFGFAKNEKDNIRGSELALLKKLAKGYLDLVDSDLNQLIKKRRLIEVQ